MAYGACQSANDQYAKRIAYVIENGKVTHAYDVKKPADHPQEVLKDVS